MVIQVRLSTEHRGVHQRKLLVTRYRRGLCGDTNEVESLSKRNNQISRWYINPGTKG